MQKTERIVKARDTRIPALGFGTYELTGPNCSKMVTGALNAGYRHVDTAQIYGNEELVGAGIEDAEIDRGDIFLTTKVWFDSFEPAKLESSVEGSLKKLRTEYVDLLLLHWPVFEDSMEPTLEALLRQKEKGRARAVGVSNFTLAQLKQANDFAGEHLVTNQVEYHPFLDQSRMLEALVDNQMALTAYSPLARGKIFKEDAISRVARERGVDEAQVTLAWLLGQPGVVAIPKSSSMEHALSNLKGSELELSEEERAAIDKIGSPEGRLVDPSFAPDWD
ncbi:MAG: aldo/keto reductase [Candidatus Eremiobacteraeota bacterium]|nr:aldo/keto reductase [Candidatus Eremiobacteraeota bacterium]